MLGTLPTRSRKKEGIWLPGLGLVIVTALLLVLAIFLDIRRFQLILFLGPISVIFEQKSRLKGKLVSFMTLDLFLSQAYLYYEVLGSEENLKCAMIYIWEADSYFPIWSYCVLFLATSAGIFAGKQRETSDQWKEEKGGDPTEWGQSMMEIRQDKKSRTRANSQVGYDEARPSRVSDQVILSEEKFGEGEARNRAQDGSFGRTGEGLSLGVLSEGGGRRQGFNKAVSREQQVVEGSDNEFF